MVEGLYESFNLAFKVGREDYSAEHGFEEKYPYS